MSDLIWPYMNEDGDWWAPVSEANYRDARRLVKEHIYDPEETRLVYKGKTEAWLDSEHEGWCNEKCPSNRHLLAWHFFEEETPQ